MAAAEQLDDLYQGIRSGDLEVRLASSPDDIDAVQALRYKVFYKEMGAVPDQGMRQQERDFDQFDPACDHLIVTDSSCAGSGGSVVGTYRLSRRRNATKTGGFYTSGEYDISAILEQRGEVLELGRSCVAADYRNGHTMALLWRGVAAYVFNYDVAWMFGCASLNGVDINKLALPLSYLHHYHMAPSAIRPRALAERYNAMDKVPRSKIEKRMARALLPPLVKGYLRVGCFVGDGAVIDFQFQTIDVCIVIKTDGVAEKYRQHYEHGRHSA